MANPTQFERLTESVEECNQWRRDCPREPIDLSGATLVDITLAWAISRRSISRTLIFPVAIQHWEEATDKGAARERQMRDEIEAQRVQIVKLTQQLASR
jgi:hypothetical protein